MEHLNWDLSVLSRAVSYSNLSGASTHVGLSQPQLSRIVAKLEEQFHVTLLDREAKRKSSWTPAAFRLAELYRKTMKHFQSEVLSLVEGTLPNQIRVGALDGLAELASKFCYHAFSELQINTIELHVYDLSDLEQFFVNGDLDFAFTSRQPGRKRFRHVKPLGFQSLERMQHVGSGGEQFEILSSFEHTPHARPELSPTSKKLLVSNSLFVRKIWLECFGGTATMPSTIHQNKAESDREEPVVLIGHDYFPEALWQRLVSFDQ